MDKKESNKAGVPVIPELLAPAGNFEKMVTAIHYGADAVYMGGKQFSLRAKAGNFSDQAMAEAVSYAHEHGVKVYVTINILAHNRDFEGLDQYLYHLQDASVDGLIIADPGIVLRARTVVPNIPIHLSTQANVTNGEAARFWFEQGAGRLNLARELSLDEIREVRAMVTGELEIFVHGALCISYSGRCMLSNYMTGRDANQGACAHPCRYSYSLVEEKRPGEHFPVEEDERGTYIFNSKDLCLLQGLPELVSTGVDSLKIEGRMKSIFYVGGVTRIYRAALDYLKELPAKAWENPAAIRLPEILAAEIAKTGTRGGSENFFRERPGAAEMLYSQTRVDMEVEPVAVIRREGDAPLVEARNVLETGDQIEYMQTGIECLPLTVIRMETEKGEEVSRANPGNRVVLHTEPLLREARLNGILRRNKKC
jgi:U32 family peptidase